MSNRGNVLQSDKKWKVFAYILLMIIVVGTALSLLTKITLIEDDKATRPKIALIDSAGPEGESLKNSVRLYVDTINKSGGFKGRPLELIELDESSFDKNKVLADTHVVAAVGFLKKKNLLDNYRVFTDKKIPLVTPIYLDNKLPGVISLGGAPQQEASFSANYARNIAQQRIMYVIGQAGEEFDQYVTPFISVYERFQTPIQKTWLIESEASDAEIDALVEEVKNIDIGALYIAVNPSLSAKLLQKIRETGSILDIYGPSQLANNVFIQTLESIAGDDSSGVMNGVSTTTPVLFDTANDKAQRFKSNYQQVYGYAPDWLAALSYDAATIALLGSNPKKIDGITGNRKIQESKIELPLQMGIYNGDALISAPIQMLPIGNGANFNYVEALKDGRVLYVNGRFMFKTNVVYSGFTINEISNIDTHAETADINMSMWFRYQGDFKPEDVSVLNASNKKIEFGEPEEVSSNGDVQYRRYNIKNNFKLNFTDQKRAYAHHVAGISFRHRVLNRNNLMYVVDVLGMPAGNDLIKDLKSRKITESGSGWVIDNAWVSQDVEMERGEGAPQYVGITGEEPLFSNITLGVEIKPEHFSARDFISVEYFIYIAIFGFLGVLFANVLDTRKQAWYWAVQSWMLRIIFWPLLLLSAGNILIDLSYARYTQATTANVVMVYDALWWLLVAHLVNLAVLRFVWVPLEKKAGRKIPNVMKILVSMILLSFAVAGVIATVFNQPLTSFLATSGVLAMIVGFAVQANIANIFSGIILNIERPFKVGDYIKINDVIGQVKDITWRTVRIESNAGPTVSLANSNVSESFMENYSETPHGILAETIFYTPPDTNVERVLQIIIDAIEDNSQIMFKDDPMFAPMPRFKGIENLNGQWVAKFSAGYRVKILPKKSQASQELWFFVKARCEEEGISLVQSNSQVAVISADKP